MILVLVKKDPKSLIVEAWEQVPNPNQRTTHAPGTILTIDEAGVVTPANRSLVNNALFDSPHPNSTPIMFTTAEHTNIAGYIFSFSWPGIFLYLVSYVCLSSLTCFFSFASPIILARYELRS